MPEPQDNPPTEPSEMLPVVTFGRVVTGPNSSVTLVGTVTQVADVQSLDIVYASKFSQAVLGRATVNPDGTFSLDFTGQTAAYELNARVTDTDGSTTGAPSGITIVAGVTGEPFTTVINYYTPNTNNLLQSVYVKASGVDLYVATPTALPDGGTSYTYADGSFFRGKDYFGFVDSYDSYGQISQHTEYHRDGTNVTDVLGYGKTVTAIGNDTFNEYANGTKFVIGEGVGPETINGFRVGGINHDTVNLPDTDAGRLGGILAHATSGDLGTTLHLGHGDTLTFSDVSITALQRHRGDFTFGA